MTREHKRFIRGLLAAPLVGGYFAIVLLMWCKNLTGVAGTGLERSIDSSAGGLLAAAFIAVFYAIIASPIFYIGMLGVGLPIFWLLQKYHIERWWSYSVAGALVGFAIPPLGGEGLLPRTLNGIAAGLILLVFWYVARRGVEDARSDHQA